MLVFTHSVGAYYDKPYHWTGSTQWDVIENNPPQVNYVYEQPVQIVYTQPVKTVYQVQDTTSQPRPATVLASNTVSKPTAKTTTKSDTTTTVNQVETPIDDQNNGLTALSIAGTNKFMPDTVFEWILVVILILIIIVIARQFRRKDKHEIHHEVSPVGHH